MPYILQRFFTADREKLKLQNISSLFVPNLKWWKSSSEQLRKNIQTFQQ